MNMRINKVYITTIKLSKRVAKNNFNSVLKIKICFSKLIRRSVLFFLIGGGDGG